MNSVDFSLQSFINQSDLRSQKEASDIPSKSELLIFIHILHVPCVFFFQAKFYA